ncbi:hypothetical protein BV898_16667 [Hypsibius exemplaris]|uniref:Peptidase M12A domain-containing protein n=1 Tax=Hypsibius exemplaris TaxID=2072580 RepID=A0A9X6NMD7_HYPEX|nr:hypothetical protein BV898_16667 [Hypsibius exemplaris]
MSPRRVLSTCRPFFPCRPFFKQGYVPLLCLLILQLLPCRCAVVGVFFGEVAAKSALGALPMYGAWSEPQAIPYRIPGEEAYSPAQISFILQAMERINRDMCRCIRFVPYVSGLHRAKDHLFISQTMNDRTAQRNLFDLPRQADPCDLGQGQKGRHHRRTVRMHRLELVDLNLLRPYDPEESVDTSSDFDYQSITMPNPTKHANLGTVLYSFRESSASSSKSSGLSYGDCLALARLYRDKGCKLQCCSALNIPNIILTMPQSIPPTGPHTTSTPVGGGSTASTADSVSPNTTLAGDPETTPPPTIPPPTVAPPTLVTTTLGTTPPLTVAPPTLVTTTLGTTLPSTVAPPTLITTTLGTTLPPTVAPPTVVTTTLGPIPPDETLPPRPTPSTTLSPLAPDETVPPVTGAATLGPLPPERTGMQ